MVRDELSTANALGVPDPRTFSETAGMLERARAGDQGAFEQLWQRYAPGLQVLINGKLWRGLSPTLRPRLLADAEDILLTVMGRAFDKLDGFQYQGAGSFLAWLCRITQNEVTNRISYWTSNSRDPRREQQRAPSADSSGASSDGRFVASARGPMSELLADEKRARVARALASLPDRHYEILYWRFFAGAPWEEIAELAGAPSADAARMECFNNALPAFAAALARPEP